MLAPNDSIPIHLEPSISDYTEGIYEIRGLMRYENQALVLEYRATSVEEVEMADAAKRAIETHTIPLQDLRSLTFKSSIFSAKLRIEVNRMAALDGLPGSDHHQVKVRIPRSARKAASAFTAYLNAELAELKLGEG